MESSTFNKKILLTCAVLSILLLAAGYTSHFYFQSLYAKKGGSTKTSESKSASTSSSTNGNNSIALNALELKNETYRWQNTSEGINPPLHLVAHTDYAIKIKNPTDTKHELIIGSNGTELKTSKDILPGKNREFVFNANSTGMLEYHCQYHPDTMKGVIYVSGQ